MAIITKKTINRYIILLFITVILITLLPIKFPLTIKSYGKIYPAKEWYITKEQNENITTKYLDRLGGGIKNYYINNFERGDIVSYNLEPKISFGSKVSMGDTIARISSNMLLQLQAELLGEIVIAIANLNVFQTGENQPVVDEAQYKLENAKTKYENQKIIFDRIFQLYNENLISDEIFEIEGSLSQQYEIDVQIARSQLNAVLEGAKPETIQLLKSNIKTLQDQYSILSERISQGILISPINGIVCNPSAADTILLIQDTTKFVAFFPIRWKYASFLKKDQKVHIRIPKGGVWGGVIRSIDNNVQVIGGDARIIVTVELEEGYSNINIGQVVEGKIHSKSATILNQISHFIKNTIDFRARRI